VGKSDQIVGVNWESPLTLPRLSPRQMNGRRRNYDISQQAQKFFRRFYILHELIGFRTFDTKMGVKVE
jgi:hypothetical protein